MNPATPNTARRVTPRALAGAAAVLALAGAGHSIVMPRSRPNGGPPIGGPFQLQAGDGKTITDTDLRGHPFLVYFGYTHCPDVCPTTLAQILDIFRQLPDKPIRALFITVDPERDTPALMADYVSSFDSRIIGLSGVPERSLKSRKNFTFMPARCRATMAAIQWIIPRSST
jgi:protein SCO1/2